MTVLEPNFRILALDPGGTTGWAAYSALIIPGIEFATISMSQRFTCGHITGDKHHVELENFLGSQRLAAFVVVCETFDDTASGHSVNLMAREYIGVVEKWCQENDVPLVMQRPGVAKPFTKDINLKRLGIWKGVKWKHAMDAYRHLLWHMIHTTGRKDLLETGWPNN